MFRALALGSSVLYACLAAGAALAADFDRTGFYVALSGFGVESPGSEKELENSTRGNVDVDVDTTGGFGAVGGYRFHPNMAFEVEFDFVPKQNIDIQGQGSGRIRTYTTTFNGKVFLLTGRVQPYLTGGIGVMYFDSPVDSQTDLVGRLGAGLDVYVIDSIYVDVGVEGLIGTGDIEDYNQLLFGAGVGFRF